MSRIVRLFACAAVVSSFCFSSSQVQAQTSLFDLSVRHNINGRSLGLSKDLPVTAFVYRDGSLLAEVPLVFKQTFPAELPAGTYQIEVVSEEIGPIPSMSVGPVDIPPGVNVSILARLSGGKTPILDVKVRD